MPSIFPWAFLALAGVGLLFLLIEPLTRRGRMACEALAIPTPPVASGPLPVAQVVGKPDRPPPAAATPEKAPALDSPAEYLRHALSDIGLSGALTLPFLGLAVASNIEIMQLGFSYLLDRVGRPLVEVAAFGIPVTVTDMDIYAALPTFGLIVVGAAIASARKAGTGWPVLVFFMLVAGALVGLEVLVTLGRAQILIEELPEGSRSSTIFLASSMLQAFAAASTELVGGYLGVHRFVIPAIQCAAWFVLTCLAWPYRALARLRRARAPKPARPVVTLPLAPFRLSVARWLDEALMDPLRRLDDFALGWVRRLHTKENRNA